MAPKIAKVDLGSLLASGDELAEVRKLMKEDLMSENNQQPICPQTSKIGFGIYGVFISVFESFGSFEIWDFGFGEF